MKAIKKHEWISQLWFLLLAGLLGGYGLTSQAANPEPTGWYAGDMHVHRSCGGVPEAVSSLYNKMATNDLAVISLLADMGNGEVQDPVTDLPLVTGEDASISTPGRIVHWDAEWHWDATYGQFEHQALGGHVVALGLSEAHQIWEEYTYPIFQWAHEQNGIAGFVHMQYLDEGIPQTLNCCKPIEYPVEVALGAADFISEDVAGSESAIQAYYRLLNNGFRPGFVAGTDYPCGVSVLGSLLTYVQVPPPAQMTYNNWIEGVKQGRTVVSRNGHNEFLNLTVNGTATPGDEIKLTSSGTLPVTIDWTAKLNLTGTIELVHNGVVVASKQASIAAGATQNLTAEVTFTKSGWLAARRMNINGHQLHTGAVFVTVNNAPVRVSATDAEFYVQWMDNLLEKTSPGGEWSSYFVTSRDAAQARYQAAKTIYQQIALEAGAMPPPLVITTTSLPNGILDLAYSATLTASGGITPHYWSISSGLPPGLTLNNGTITGTPTTAGSYSFTVQVSDASNPIQTVTKLLTISISATPPVETTIWPVTATPSVVSDPDTSAVELGVKFRSSVNGFVTGIRFYKGTANTGTHIGSLWDISGNLLAQVTFNNETASGWQQVNFSNTVAISANTIYVASYHAPNGRYSADQDYFASTGFTNGSLYALRDGESGGNGVYLYGSVGFPSNTYQSSNYWVDVVFTADMASDSISPTAPGNLTAEATSATQINLNWTASTDNIGVTGYQVERCQGTGCTTFAQVATVTVANYSDNGLTSGTAYQYRVRATDAAGNNSNYSNVASATTQALLDAQPPTVTMTSPANGATVTGTAVTVSANASDNVGVTSVQFLLDGEALGSPDTTAPYSINWDTTATADGLHTLSAQARDPAGNTGTTLVIGVTVSNGVIPTDTGFRVPSANASVTTNAGDNNGFESNPAYAYANDGLFALDTNSGTNTNTSCINNGKDKHIYQDYGFDLASSLAIKGIEVRLDAKADSKSGAPKMCVQLSWNGGVTWTAAKSTAALSKSVATYILGGVADTWGRTWVVDDFLNSNFRLRIINVASSTARDFSLDWVAVRVTYQ